MRRFSFTWWHVAWFVLFLSGLSFRARTAAEISQSPVDSFAAYRILCVAIVGSILFFRLTLKKTGWIRYGTQGVIGFFALYALLSLISTVWSVSPAWTLYKSTEFFVDLFTLAAIVASVESVDEYRRFADWTWTLLGILIGTAWLGAIVDPGDALFSDPSMRFAGLPMRLVGVVPVVSCNDLSEYSAIIGLVMLSRIFLREPESEHKSTRHWIIFGIMFLTMVFAQTRGAFLAFMVGVVVLLILTRRYIAVIVGGATSFVLAVPLLFLTKFGTHVQDYFIRGQKTDEATGMSGRLDTWTQAWDKFVQAPFTGYGGFAGAKFVILSRRSVASDTLSSHFDSLVNIGIFGWLILIITLLWIGYLLYKSLRDHRLTDPENFFALEMFLAFLVLFIRSFESSNLNTHPILAFLTVIGAAEVFRRRRKQAQLEYASSGPALV
jgi:O-antigen ligase